MTSGALAALTSWTLEGPVIAGLAIAGALYGWGGRRLARMGHVGLLKRWQTGCFWAGMLTLVVALLSPVATYGDELFFMHMIEHLLLVLVAPPLLWLGAPLLPCLWALPRPARVAAGRLFTRNRPIHRAGHVATDPRVAATIFLAVMLVWHSPRLYDAAEGVSAIHALEHALFFGSALLYWWPVIHPTGGRRRLGRGMSMLYLFVASLEGVLIGAPLTFANHVIYTHYAEAPRVLPLSALADQQLGGLIMWVPTGFFWLGAVLVTLARWFQEEAAAAAGSPPTPGVRSAERGAPIQ